MTFKVSGMACNGCEKSVENMVAKINGITNVKADHISNRVRIEYASTPPDRSQVQTAILKAGFELTDEQV